MNWNELDFWDDFWVCWISCVDLWMRLRWVVYRSFDSLMRILLFAQSAAFAVLAKCNLLNYILNTVYN